MAAITILVCALAIIDQPSNHSTGAQATWVAQINPDHVTRIELTKATSKTVLKQDSITGDWNITSPSSRRLMRLESTTYWLHSDAIQADVQVDEGNLKDYKLDAAGGIVVELWTDIDKPAASFTIGADAAGGSSFVRISGDDAVYRALIGGRRRFDHAPADWRNRVVVDRSRPTFKV